MISIRIFHSKDLFGSSPNRNRVQNYTFFLTYNNFCTKKCEKNHFSRIFRVFFASNEVILRIYSPILALYR